MNWKNICKKVLHTCNRKGLTFKRKELLSIIRHKMFQKTGQKMQWIV